MQILNATQIQQKIDRMAWEILERHFGERRVYLLGINNKGYAFAQLLRAALEKISRPHPDILLHRLVLDPADPLRVAPEIMQFEAAQLRDEAVILVDDVANTGRTLFYAFVPLMGILTRQVEVAVMVDRKHKLFPVQVNYVGLSLATTLMENIEFTISGKEMQAELL